MSDCERKCEFCDKRGLPILPVRYAIAESVGRVPKLTAPMTADEVHALPETSQAQYTARLLRSGYLYVYDEARKRWEGYFVNGGGYYLYFDPKQGMPVALTKLREPCTDEGHREIASCITIRDPKRASLVWLAFSDVEWTAAVLQKHEDAAYRKRHMRIFDVKAWLASQKQPHALPIAKLADTVAECTRLMRPYRDAFGASPFKFYNRQGQAENLIKTSEMLAPKGAILAIPDPAGVAQELGALMAVRTKQFLTDPKRSRQLANLSTISMLEQGIKNQVQLAESAASEELARDAETGLHDTYNSGWMPGMPLRPDPQLAARYRAITKEDLDRAATTTWKKYQQYFNEPARAQWEEQHKAEAETFGKTRIEPLAQGHIAWMQSDAMTHYFNCCYDPKSWQASLVYVQVVTACVENTQDKQLCHDLYSTWLEKAGATDAQNILAKALKYNNQEIEDAIKKVGAQDLDKRSIPWDNVLNVYKTAEEKLGKGGADEMAKLLVQIAGPAAKVLNKTLDGTAGSAFVAIAGGIARTKLEKMTYRGKRSEFRRVLVRELIKSTGGHITPRQLKQAVLAEMNRLHIRSGRAQDGMLDMKWLMYIDPEVAAKAATAQEAAAAIRTVKQLEEAAQMNWRNVMSDNVRLGVVTGLLQFVSLGKLLEDDAKAMSHEKKEVAWRLGAGYAALGGTLAEVTGNAMQGTPSVISSAGQGWRNRIANFLGRNGARAGVAAGVIMAVWDGIRAYEEGQRGNFGIAALYVGSGFLGLVLTYGFIAMWGAAIMFWLVAALVLIVILIELNKPNKLMEWLQRCAFGKGPGNWGSIEEDQKQFELALKG